MRKLLLLGAVLAIGCGDPASPDDFRVTVAPVPATIQAGQTMQLEVDIYNGSDEGRYLAMSPCYPPFEILDASGQVVGPGPQACALSLTTPLWIEPNTSVEATYVWAGESSGTTPSGSPIYLAPGAYQVRPFVEVLDVGKSYGTAVTVTIVQ